MRLSYKNHVESLDHPRWKFKFTSDYSVKTCIVGYEVETVYCKLTTNGTLTIKKDYAYNGANGCIARNSNIIPAGIHDCLYQLIIEGLLPPVCRRQADRVLYVQFKKWGMYSWLAWVEWKAVLAFQFCMERLGRGDAQVA